MRDVVGSFDGGFLKEAAMAKVKKPMKALKEPSKRGKASAEPSRNSVSAIDSGC